MGGINKPSPNDSFIIFITAFTSLCPQVYHKYMPIVSSSLFPVEQLKIQGLIGQYLYITTSLFRDVATNKCYAAGPRMALDVGCERSVDSAELPWQQNASPPQKPR